MGNLLVVDEPSGLVAEFVVRGDVTVGIVW